MARPKVALVLEATAGGTRKHVRDLALGLDRRAFEVHAVLSFERSSEMRADLPALAARGVRVHMVPMVRRISPGHDAHSMVELVRVFARERFDIVHTHSAKAGFLGRLAARLAGAGKVVHTPHVWPFDWARGAVRSLYLRLEAHAARWTDALVCVGPHQRDVAILEGVVSSDEASRRLRVIPNGVNSRMLTPRPDQRRRVRYRLGLPPETLAVGMVGRLVRQKGVDLFIDAAARIARVRADARFFVIGDGPQRGRMMRYARSNGLGNGRMTFLGPRGDVEQLYAGLDVFVLPSLYEGLPYVLLEAAATGLPIVATRVPGVEDVLVDGESGLLVPQGEVDELSRAIETLLSDGVRRRKLGRSAKEEVERRFRLSRFLSEHERLYAELLARPGPQRRAVQV